MIQHTSLFILPFRLPLLQAAKATILTIPAYYSLQLNSHFTYLDLAEEVSRTISSSKYLYHLPFHSHLIIHSLLLSALLLFVYLSLLISSMYSQQMDSFSKVATSSILSVTVMLFHCSILLSHYYSIFFFISFPLLSAVTSQQLLHHPVLLTQTIHRYQISCTRYSTNSSSSRRTQRIYISSLLAQSS